MELVWNYYMGDLPDNVCGRYTVFIPKDDNACDKELDISDFRGISISHACHIENIFKMLNSAI